MNAAREPKIYTIYKRVADKVQLVDTSWELEVIEFKRKN